MEMTLNMGAFEALDNREMMEVDGGWAQAVKGILRGWLEGEIINQTKKVANNFYQEYKDDVRGYNFLCR